MKNLPKLPFAKGFFAIHMDAMVPEVNKKAIRKGRVVAARDSVAAAVASINEKSVGRIRRIAASIATTAKRYEN